MPNDHPKTGKPGGCSARPACSAVEFARREIVRLETMLEPALEQARRAHRAAMGASEALGIDSETGASHACLGLMEVSVRALSQANDAARYSRHAMTYPPNR